METDNKIQFGGITCGARKNFNDLFDIVYSDDGQMYAQTKETFYQDDDDLSFYYKYAVEVLDMRTCGIDDGNNLYFALHMMIMPQSFNESFRESFQSYTDLSVDEANAFDLVNYGGCTVKMAEESMTLDAYLYNPEENKTVQTMLDNIASVVSFIDSMRGFYIDKTWNRMGSTGWDTVAHCVQGNDLLKPAIDRYLKNAI